MKIIILCGSVTKTPKPVWEARAQYETLAGNIVLMVNVWGMRDYLHNDIIGKGFKEILDVVHKRKIALSDEVQVLRLNGYIGESTKSEIAFAKSLLIPVSYIEVTDEEIKKLYESQDETKLRSNKE